MIKLLCSIFMIASVSRAEDLSLEQYIERLKKDDAQIRRFVHQRMQTRFQADLQLADSAWVVSLTNSHGIAIGDLPTTRRTEISLDKTFRDTGTDLSASYNTNTLADRQERIHSAELRQSLLRNFFGYQTRLAERGIEKQNEVTLWQVVESYEDYMAEKLGQYLDFVLAWQNFKTAEQQLKDIKEIHSEVTQRRNQNVALSVDVHRAEVESLQYERLVLEARIEMERLKKLLFSGIEDSDKGFGDILPSKEIPFLNSEIQFVKERESFLKGGRTIKIHQSRESSADLNKKSLSRNYYPEAQLILGYSQDQSRRFTTPVNREEKVIGFNFSYEIDSSSRGAQLAQARYNLQQAQLQNLSEKREVTSLMESLREQIVLQRQRVEMLEKQIKVSEKLLKGENRRFKRGVIDLKTLIETQNTQTQAKYELTSQKVLLARHVLNWKTLLDQLVDSAVLD